VARLDERAFAACYQHNSRGLWSYLYRVTGKAADADDLVQEAFCRLLQAEVGALSDEELRRYVFRIGSNLLADRWRRATQEASWLDRLRGTTAAQVEPEYDDDSVSREFAALKPRERALLWLAYVEGESHEEIANALGLSRGSIKVLLSRARARLRDQLVAKGLTARA
jgi:RNA polymerase sigma-70 factor (ECF subfamily)